MKEKLNEVNDWHTFIIQHLFTIFSLREYPSTAGPKRKTGAISAAGNWEKFINQRVQLRLKIENMKGGKNLKNEQLKMERICDENVAVLRTSSSLLLSVVVILS